MSHIRFHAALLALAASTSLALGQSQFLELGKRHLPREDIWTLIVSLGDVDGDGDLDIVDGSSTENRLYLNDGKGEFSDATASHLPKDDVPWTSGIALGDVDGDGDLDMVVGKTYTQNRLYVNDGNGKFSDVTATHLPKEEEQTTGVTLGDVDGDGDLDLVCGSWGNIAGTWNRLYLNDGKGRFTDATSRLPHYLDRGAAFVFADVDGDGDLDLVFGDTVGQNGLYLNDGKGNFTDVSASNLPKDTDVTGALAVGDVDGDGDLDIVCGNQGAFFGGQQNRLYLNDGKGKFTDATSSHLPAVNDKTNTAQLADVDGDGDLDLVFGNDNLFASEQNRLCLNDGTGHFTEFTASRMPNDTDQTYSGALGDVDGDGDLDIVFGNRFAEDKLYVNDGSGRFTDATTFTMPRIPGATAAAFGDVDGDGDLDIVLASAGALPDRLLLNDGKGAFTDASAARLPQYVEWTSAVVLGDVDGDGDLDIVLGCSRAEASSSRLYTNDGKGKFTDATASHVPLNRDTTYATALGDVDGDGDLDIVFGNLGQNRLYLNNGKGSFTDATASRMPADRDTTYATALGDVDGDGDLDIVFGNDGKQNRLYLNDGKGKFTDGTSAGLPNDSYNTRNAALGDVDGDGDLDLVIGNWGLNKLYLNDGKGKFTDVTATHFPVDGLSNAVALGDVDGDRDLDIVFGTVRDQLNRLYVNDGKGKFTDATLVGRLPEDRDDTMDAALGDMDGDGDLDLILGTRVYANLDRQVDTPLLSVVGRSHELDIYAKPGYATSYHLAVPFVGTAEKKLRVPVFGTFGLDLSKAIVLPLAVILPNRGKIRISLAIPKDATLIGTPLFSQALIIPDLVHPPSTWRFTNVTGDTLIR